MSVQKVAIVLRLSLSLKEGSGFWVHRSGLVYFGLTLLVGQQVLDETADRGPGPTGMLIHILKFSIPKSNLDQIPTEYSSLCTSIHMQNERSNNLGFP